MSSRVERRPSEKSDDLYYAISHVIYFEQVRSFEKSDWATTVTSNQEKTLQRLIPQRLAPLMKVVYVFIV